MTVFPITLLTLIIASACQETNDSICDAEVCRLSFASKGHVLDGAFPDLVSNGPRTNFTACCINNSCFSDWDDRVVIEEEVKGCFDPDLNILESGSCLCEEGFPIPSGFDCLKRDQCYCGTTAKTSRHFLHGQKACELKQLEKVMTCSPACPDRGKNEKRSADEPVCRIENGVMLSHCDRPDCYMVVASQAGIQTIAFEEGPWSHAEGFCKKELQECCASVQFYWEGGAGEMSEVCNKVQDPCYPTPSLFTYDSLERFECLTTWGRAIMIIVASVLGLSTLCASLIAYNCLCRCFPSIRCRPLYIDPRCAMCCCTKDKSHKELIESYDDQELSLLPGISDDEEGQDLESPPELPPRLSQKKPCAKPNSYLEGMMQAEVPVAASTLSVESIATMLNANSAEVVKVSPGLLRFKRGNLVRVNVPKALLLPVLLSLIWCAEAACDRVNVMTSQYTQCTTVGSLKTCRLETASSIQIPTVGKTGCTEYVDGNGDVVYKLSVKTSKVGYEIPQQVSYYTALNKLRSGVWTEYHLCCCGAFDTYNCKCRHALSTKPTCGRGTTNPWTNPTNGAHISDFGKYWSTMKCDIHGIEMHDIYSSWQLVPQGDTIPVYRLGDLRAFAVVTVVAISRGETVINREIKVYQNSVYQLGETTLVFNQINPASVPSFSGKVVAKYKGKMIVTAAAEKNVPVLGSLGEIQASSNDFILGWRSYLATPAFDSLQMRYSGKPHNPSLSVSYAEFEPVTETTIPGVYNGWSLYFEGSNIMAHKSGNSMVEFRLSYSGPVSIQVTKNIPTVTSFAYNCTVLTGDSNQTELDYSCEADTGYSAIECKREGVYQVVDYLTCDGKNHTIPDASISGCDDLKVGTISRALSCGTKEVISLIEHNFTNSANEPSGGFGNWDTSGLSIGSFFGGSLSWLSGIIIAVAAILVFVVSSMLVIKLLIPWLAARKTKRVLLSALDKKETVTGGLEPVTVADNSAIL